MWPLAVLCCSQALEQNAQGGGQMPRQVVLSDGLPPRAHGDLEEHLHRVANATEHIGPVITKGR